MLNRLGISNLLRSDLFRVFRLGGPAEGMADLVAAQPQDTGYAQAFLPALPATLDPARLAQASSSTL